MTEAAFWWVNTGSVQTYLGSNAFDGQLADAVDVACWVEDGVKLVRNAQGDEVVSTSTVFGALTDADKFAVGSNFTYNGRISTVIDVTRFDSGSLDLELDHFEAHLT